MLATITVVGAAEPNRRGSSMSDVSLRLRSTTSDLSGQEVAFAPDGHHWAVGDGGRLHLGRDEKLVVTTPTSTSPRGPLVFSADGTQLRWGAALFASDGKSAPPAADEALQRALASAITLAPAGIEVVCAASNRDGSVVAAVGRPRISERHGPSGVQRSALVVMSGAVSAVAWSGPVSDAPTRIVVHDHLVVAAGHSLHVFDARTGRTVGERVLPTASAPTAIAFDGTVVYLASSDGTVCAWDFTAAHLRWTARPSTESLRGLALDAKGGTLAATGWDDQLRLLATNDGHVLIATPLTAHGEAVAFSPDGARLLVAQDGAKAELRIYDLSR
jgi:WD40 repeat protein